MEVYQSWEGVSAHDLMLLDRSFSHYTEAKKNPRPATTAMRFGSAAHTWILEPEIAPDAIVVAPNVDRRTKAGKQAWAEFEETANGRIIINEDEARHLAQMASAVATSPAAMAALDAAPWREHSVQFDLPQHGLRGRARPDACGHNIIVDLKTTADASPSEFRRSCATFRYHWQACWYRDNLAPLLGEDTTFIFVCVERQPPYSVGVYTLDSEAMEAARNGIDRALRTYANAGSDNWSGYASGLITTELSLPRWIVDRDNA